MKGNHSEFWTPERVATLRAEWAQGVSVRAIAAGLGTTKGTIIGKAGRLKLGMHVKCMAHPSRPKKEKRRCPPRTRFGAVRQVTFKARPLPPPQAPDTLEIAFMDLEAHHCRYATTRDTPFLFCGVDKIPDSSYCAFHHNLCHEKPKPRIVRVANAPYARAA